MRKFLQLLLHIFPDWQTGNPQVFSEAASLPPRIAKSAAAAPDPAALA
jgi:hypothetical protein